MATAETDLHESALRRADEYANRCGQLMVEVDRAKTTATQWEKAYRELRKDTDKRLDMIDSIKHGGLRQLFAIANDTHELRRVLDQFRTDTKVYSELQDLVSELVATSDEYLAAKEIEDWHRSWE